MPELDLVRHFVYSEGMTTISMSELFRLWLESGERAHDTRYHYEKMWLGYCEPLHEVQAAKLDTPVIALCYSNMLLEGLAPSTVNLLRKMLSALCAYGVKHQYLAANYAKFAHCPKNRPTSIIVPSPEEVEHLLCFAAQDDYRMYTFLTVSAALGTRRSETCAIRWKSVCLQEGNESILVDAALDSAPGHQGELKATKTFATATLSIGEKTATVLDIWLHMRHDDLFRNRGDHFGPAPQSFVFNRDPLGDNPWTPQHATNEFAKLRASAGLGSHVTLKSLRHFHATQLISHGVDVRTVAGRLRHANPAITLQVYAAFDKRADRAAAALWDNLSA